MINNLISIIIPVYNVAPYLKQFLDSIVNQTYDDLEIIIVNDGSIDDSLKICEVYGFRDKRIKIINQENKGVSVARNNGINLASGDYVLFVDGDDWLETDTVEKVFTLMNQNDLVCFSYFKNYFDNCATRKLGLNGNFDASFLKRRITGLLGEELKDPSQLDSLVTVWGKVYKTAIIKKYAIAFKDLKEIGTWEDGLFNLEYLNFSKSVYIMDQAFYHYRKTNQHSLTSVYKPNLVQQWGNLYGKLETFIEKQKVDVSFQKAFQNRISLGIIGLGINELYADKPFSNKYKSLQEILSSRRYRNAVKDLPLKYFPLHWKVFFFYAKYNMPFPLLIMLMAVKKIINK